MIYHRDVSTVKRDKRNRTGDIGGLPRHKRSNCRVCPFVDYRGVGCNTAYEYRPKYIGVVLFLLCVRCCDRVDVCRRCPGAVRGVRDVCIRVFQHRPDPVDAENRNISQIKVRLDGLYHFNGKVCVSHHKYIRNRYWCPVRVVGYIKVCIPVSSKHRPRRVERHKVSERRIGRQSDYISQRVIGKVKQVGHVCVSVEPDITCPTGCNRRIKVQKLVSGCQDCD